MVYHGGNIYNLDKKVIDFSVNINPLGIPKSFEQALQKRLIEFSLYPDLQYQSVKKAAASYFNVAESRILMGNGAVDIIYKVIRMGCFEKGIIAAPTFGEYDRAFKVCGKKSENIFCYDFESNTFQLDLVANHIEKNDLVVLCNPNNPTGSLIKIQRMKEFCSYLEKKGAMLLIDEAFMDFLEHGDQVSMLSEIEKFSNLTLIRAATKFFGMPGIRLGYGIFGNIKFKQKIEELSEPWCLNTAAVIGAEVLFQDQEYKNLCWEWLKEEGPAFFHELSQITGIQVFPSKSNFYLCKLTGDIKSGKLLSEKLLVKGILIRTADGFFGLDDSFFRLAVKKKEDNLILVQALKEVLEGK